MKKKLQNERGSATIEFLAMVPLVLLIMMIFWQFLVAGYAVIISQSALNEAAKTYSVTDGSLSEANSTAKDFIQNAGGNLEFRNIADSRNGNKFRLTLYVNLNLVFIPEKYVGKLPKISFSKEISGRVME